MIMSMPPMRLLSLCQWSLSLFRCNPPSANEVNIGHAVTFLQPWMMKLQDASQLYKVLSVSNKTLDMERFLSSLEFCYEGIMLVDANQVGRPRWSCLSLAV